MSPEDTGELHKIREETKRDRKRDGYFWLIMIVTVLGSCGLAMAFSAHNTRQSERKFCALMAASVVQAESRLAGYVQAPPTTEAGRVQQAQAVDSVRLLINLQHDLGCPIKGDPK